MPPKIPRLIKTNVIRMWLEGESRAMIVNKCSVGAGTISNIISSAREGSDTSSYDFDLVREMGLALKREGLSIDELVSPKRFHGILNKRGLEAEQIELLVDELDSHFFKKRGLTIEGYVDTIIKLSEISTKLEIPLENLFDSVEEKIRERQTLVEEIENLERKKIITLHNNATTIEVLEEYKKDRPLIERYEIMEKRFHSRDLDCENLDRRLQDEMLKRRKDNSRWEINNQELECITIKRGAKGKDQQSINPEDYTNMVQDLLNSPLKYKDTIPSLMRRYNRLKVNTHQTSVYGITDDSDQITN